MFSRITVYPMLILCLSSCENGNTIYPPGFENEKKYMVVLADNESIGVGIQDFITITAHLSKDASGQDCLFQCSSGTFDSVGAGLISVSKAVDNDGLATAYWFPPETPGRVIITATVQGLTEELEILVDTVPEITFGPDLPDAVAAGDALLFTLSVPAEWANTALEVKAMNATLTATGPVVDEFESGTKIMPLVDRNGMTQILLQAPAEPTFVLITVSLFGTSNSRQISVE